MLGLMQRGKPIMHLLQQHLPPDQQASLQQQQQQEHKEEQEQQQEQQQEQEQQTEAEDQAAQPVALTSQQEPGRKNLDWSEVTFVSPT
jgi:hypothetical protein